MALKIAINAQVRIDSGVGGVAFVLAGLIKALSTLDGDETYIIIGTPENRGWLQQFLGSNQEFITKPQPYPPEAYKNESLLRRLLKPVARPIIRRLRKELGYDSANSWPQVPLSDGFLESLGCDVVHFPFQEHTVCSLPSIYNPHDLQHLHYPRYFSRTEIAWRETIYPAGCHFAKTVVVASQWIKEDIVRQYAVDADKIQVIPWAPATEAYPSAGTEEVNAVREKYSLDTPFALFPAMTWEHKNHLRLIEAFQRARQEQDLKLQIICTGKRHEPQWSRIKQTLETMGLSNDVRFLGLLSENELGCIYRLSRFVIVPTLFEAASLPVFEAWHHETPVACSTVTSLPEQVADAALLFDPYSIDAMKQAIIALTNDPELRTDLAKKGRQRLKDFSWQRTALAYRAVYRRAAGISLSDEDQHLLSLDWMRNPGRREI
jgi:glycosyltransferase involved in cell wall biosynthesis